MTKIDHLQTITHRTVLSFSDKITETERIEIAPNVEFVYQVPRFRESKRFYFRKDNARFDIPTTTLEKALAILNGKGEHVTKGLRIVNDELAKKKGQRTIEVEIVDESDNFFISKTGSTFAKKDYEKAEFTRKSQAAKIYTSGYYARNTWYIGDYSTGYPNNVSGTESAREMVQYMLDIITEYKRLVSEHNKCKG